MKMIKVRIRATGQVLEMVPKVARAMIAGGTAEEVNAAGRSESMAVAPAVETAVKSASSKKPFFGKKRAS